MTTQFKIHEQLLALHKAVVARFELNGISEITENLVLKFAKEIIKSGEVEVTAEYKEEILEQLRYKILGFGPLSPLLQDSEITEIMVNGTKSIYIEKSGKLQKVDHAFINDEEVLQVINRIVSRVGRRIDASNPLVDARLPDGSRVNAIISPLSLIGPVVTIRRFPKNPPTLEDLISKGTLTSEMSEFLKKAILDKQNIIVSGGTGSGKTTTLNAIAGVIPDQQRVITIEDSAEMKIDHPHLISLESRPANLEGKGEIPIRTLLKNALRMRPDRIIVGEIRSGEALDMLQAMNTGHPGSLTTVHANNTLEALHRIETMTLMADVELPLQAIREQIRGAINLIVQQERLEDGSRKIVAISKLVVLDSQTDSGYRLEPIFKYDKVLGKFTW